MALVVICGQPASGKSTVTALLSTEFEQLGASVIILNEANFGLTKDSAYSNNVQEKSTRGKLKSAVERVLSTKHVTIIDSLNNIKGFRYELWCFARGLGIRYCMVHVDTQNETCRAWNAGRDGDKYSTAVLEDLLCRFERPDARNRWDSPLYTLRPGTAASSPEVHEQHEPDTADSPAEDAALPAVTAALAVCSVKGSDTGMAAAAATAAADTSLQEGRQSNGHSYASSVAPADSTPTAPTSTAPLQPESQAAQPHEGTLTAAAAGAAPSTSVDSKPKAAHTHDEDACTTPAAGTSQGASANSGAAPSHPHEGALAAAGLPTQATSAAAAHTAAVSLGSELSEGITLIVRAMMGLASSGTGHVTAQLTPTPATTNPKLLGTNLLHDIDQATQEVIQAITEAQVASGGQPLGVVTLQAGLPQLELHQIVSPAELRRHKRSFMKLATKVTFARLQDPLAAKRMFVEYLRQGLAR